MREYAAEFEKNTGRLESSDEATLMQLFIGGLQRDIAEKVSLTHPVSLASAISAAEEIELAVRFSRRPAAHAQRAGGQRTTNVGTGTAQRGNGRSKGRWYRGSGRGGRGYGRNSGSGYMQYQSSQSSQYRRPNQSFSAPPSQ